MMYISTIVITAIMLTRCVIESVVKTAVGHLHNDNNLFIYFCNNFSLLINALCYVALTRFKPLIDANSKAILASSSALPLTMDNS